MQRYPKGFTLIELMISAFVGVILVTFMLSLMITAKQNSMLSKALSQLQYNGHLAIHHINTAIHHAGFEGCKVSSNKHVIQGFGVPSGATLPTAISHGATAKFPLENFDQGAVLGFKFASGAFTPTPTPAMEAVLRGLKNPPVENSDLLVVYHTSNASIEVVGSMAGDSSAPIQLDSNEINVALGDHVFVGDCYKGDIVSVTNTPASSSPVIVEHAGLQYTYEPGAKLRKAVVDIYYVGQTNRKAFNGAAVRSLYRWRNGQELEIVEGLLNMQVSFGVYEAATAMVQYYSAGDAALAGRSVSFVRAGMLIGSFSSMLNLEDKASYQVLDAEFLPDDALLEDYKHYYKKVFSADVSLRNQS